jgi:hypothetical protein
VKATMEGVVLLPSALGITTASLPSITATQELVVPKSIPIILLIVSIFYYLLILKWISPILYQGINCDKLTQELLEKAAKGILIKI